MLDVYVPDEVPIPLPPAQHSEPQWWSVVRPDGIQIDRVPDVTAITIADGWLVLWCYALVIGLFKPGTWGGACVTAPPAYKRFHY